MNPPVAAAEVNALVHAWRAKATTLALSLLAVIVLPAPLMILDSQGIALPWSTLGTGLALFLLILLAAWRRDWPLRWRVLIFCLSAYSVAVLQFSLLGLLGSGRITLFCMPLLALALAGARAGWLAAGVSVALYAGFTALAGAGLLARRFVVQDNSTEPAFWVIEGVMWLAALIPLLIVITRFQALQLKIMIEERHARREIQEATSERRRLQQEVTQISEMEQQRVGAKLHAGLCQHLVAALQECKALEQQLAAQQAAERPAVRRLRRQLEEGIGTAYDAAMGLRPVDLDAETLPPALERLGRQTQKDTDLICEVRVTESELQLTPSAALNLYRIAQEAVNNAVRHAHCQRIIVELAGTLDACHLRVMDDGRPAKTPLDQAGGLGIPLMRYRAETMGGRFWIEPSPTGGTVVNCQVAHGTAAKAVTGWVKS